MDIQAIASKDQLLQHRENIEALFFESFGQRSLGKVWDWAYLDNPAGEPFVTLCYEGERLVGHYAIVPMPLAEGGQRLNTYVSMTTMVAESHRKFGLFTTLAQATYQAAREAGAAFVFGFPNAQSTPGFRKRLEWQLPEPDLVATVNKERLLALAATGYFDKRGRLSLDLGEARLRAWRLARPGGRYQWQDGLAYKEHQGGIDLLWWESAAALAALPEGMAINVLVGSDAGLESCKSFDYQFGGIGLGREFRPQSVNREMALSDLF